MLSRISDLMARRRARCVRQSRCRSDGSRRKPRPTQRTGPFSEIIGESKNRPGNGIEQCVDGKKAGAADIPVRLLDLAMQIDRSRKMQVEQLDGLAANSFRKCVLGRVHEALQKIAQIEGIAKTPRNRSGSKRGKQRARHVTGLVAAPPRKEEVTILAGRSDQVFRLGVAGVLRQTRNIPIAGIRADCEVLGPL